MSQPALPSARTEAIEATIGVVMAGVLRSSQVRALLEQPASPEVTLGMGAAHLVEQVGIAPKQAEQLLDRMEEDDLRLAVFREIEQLHRHDIRVYTIQDDGYPVHLRASADAPPFVYIWGCYSPAFFDAVTILGSSNCSRYGARQAATLSKACAAADWTVVTGGEAGIDYRASKAAFDTSGRCIIALGAGLFAHGRKHHDLYASIATSGHGCIISAVPTSTPPRSDNQITGDLLSTGLAKALAIVEASETSGALIAARVMETTWRRPVFALPGPIDSTRSRGVNHLIYRQRATPVVSIDQFMADLNVYHLPVKTPSTASLSGLQVVRL